MKVLIINGSPRKTSNTQIALDEMIRVFEEQGIETECIAIGTTDITGCRGCGGCYKTGKCVIDDIVNEIAPKFEEADGLVVGSPVYFASPNGTVLSLLDRLFYSTHFDKTMKVGTAFTCARRGGTTATWDALNKYFGITGMPIASGQYWNGIHGRQPGEAAQDREGIQQARTLANNMAFLMKSIALGRKEFGIPETEPQDTMSFIR